MFRTAPLLALAATLAFSTTAHAAPGWLGEEAPFGQAPARQFNAAAAMAPDGTVVLARFAADGRLEVRERPPGGPVGETTVIPPRIGDPPPGDNLQVLTAADGTAAVLFDLGRVRLASVRRPGRAWSDAAVLSIRESAAALAPDGTLWAVGRSPLVGDQSLWVTRIENGVLDAVPLQAPPPGAVDQAPALAIPSIGVAHVVYVQATTEQDAQQCTKTSKLLSADVAGLNAGPPTTLDAATATGAGDQCNVTRGKLLMRPALAADDAGADTVAYAVLTLDDSRAATLARHRAAGDDWGPFERLGGDPDAVVEKLLGGTGAPVLAVRSAGGLVSVTTRAADGTWPEPRALAASSLPVEAVRTGPGTAVFAWINGANARGRVVERDGTFEDPATIAPAQDLLGIGGDGFGDAVVLYTRPAGDTFALRTAGYDATPPRITGTGIPDHGRAGEGLPFIVDAEDVWGPVSATWDFGDGTREHAIATGHEFATPGERTVTVTVTDAAGNATGASGKVTVGPPLQPVPPTIPPRHDTRAPRLSRLALRGRTLSFTSDEAGRLELRLTRRGHRAQTLRRTIGAGLRHVALPRLSAGAWRVALTVTDVAGNRSRAARLTFRSGGRERRLTRGVQREPLGGSRDLQ